MNKLVILGSVAAAAVAHPISLEMANKVKESASTWEPYAPHENPLKDLSHEQLMGLLGTTFETPNGADIPEYISLDVVAPESFDARTQWPDCVHEVRDQQQCGSCWAFGASEALSDRFCVASQGKINVVLSPEDMVSCDSRNAGCEGGNLFFAWNYLMKNGIVADSCFPYTAGTGVAPKCNTTTCADGSKPKKYKCADKVHPKTVSDIKKELAFSGPMEGAFTVYEDFFNYKSGVYQHVEGDMAGGHAIKVLGYGSENGVDYWLCANSWGSSWGENGFFKIKQGDSGINDSMWACNPDVNGALNEIAFE